MMRPADPNPRRHHRQPNGTKPATSEGTEKADTQARDIANLEKALAAKPLKPPQRRSKDHG